MKLCPVQNLSFKNDVQLIFIYQVLIQGFDPSLRKGKEQDGNTAFEALELGPKKCEIARLKWIINILFCVMLEKNKETLLALEHCHWVSFDVNSFFGDPYWQLVGNRGNARTRRESYAKNEY